MAGTAVTTGMSSKIERGFCTNWFIAQQGVWSMLGDGLMGFLYRPAEAGFSNTFYNPI